MSEQKIKHDDSSFPHTFRSKQIYENQTIRFCILLAYVFWIKRKICKSNRVFFRQFKSHLFCVQRIGINKILYEKHFFFFQIFQNSLNCRIEGTFALNIQKTSVFQLFWHVSNLVAVYLKVNAKSGWYWETIFGLLEKRFTVKICSV